VFQQIFDALQQRGIKTDMAQINRMPTTTVDLDVETGRKVLALMEKLDDHDDVQSVSANFNIPQEAMAELGGQ
jgi:transcriptional/translational regulatory protein YebC/TACO1